MALKRYPEDRSLAFPGSTHRRPRRGSSATTGRLMTPSGEIGVHRSQGWFFGTDGCLLLSDQTL
ncbi:hypothetical protein T09_11731 [Trichinella sp. T9]|nr:hypothetical protein T09_11731 [Trichinella sp. T9]